MKKTIEDWAKEWTCGIMIGGERATVSLLRAFAAEVVERTKEGIQDRVLQSGWCSDDIISVIDDTEVDIP